MFLTRILYNAVKESTGLAGLAVNPNARAELKTLYEQTLASLSTLPSQAIYTQSCKAITEHRLGVVESLESVTDIEKKIGQGNIEELIYVAQQELQLIPKVKEWKIWEELKEKAPDGQWTPFQQ